MTGDLVDYLRDKLAECQCPNGTVIGRTAIGCVQQKRWSPGCQKHPTKADLDADNQFAVDWLMDQPEPEPPPKHKRWWRR